MYLDVFIIAVHPLNAA